MRTVGRGRREKDKSLLSQMQFDANLEQAILIPSRLLRGWVGGWTLNGLKAQFAPGSNLIVSTAVARHRAVRIFSIIRRGVQYDRNCSPRLFSFNLFRLKKKKKKKKPFTFMQ